MRDTFAALAACGTSARHHVHRVRQPPFVRRLPLIGFKPYAEAGALMEYGPDVRDLFYRSAAFVDKILKGTPPGNLPIERAVKFEFIVNLKTAKTLDVTVPLTLIARAIVPPRRPRSRLRRHARKCRAVAPVSAGPARVWQRVVQTTDHHPSKNVLRQRQSTFSILRAGCAHRATPSGALSTAVRPSASSVSGSRLLDFVPPAVLTSA